MTRLRAILLLLLLGLVMPGPVQADDNEAYTKVLDRLTSVQHFSDRPVLFIIGFDTTKSMSVEFDRAKRITQLILSRYGAPTDSVFVFGFANKPEVLPATSSPKEIPAQGSDKVLGTLNEGILSLPRSSEFGTVFGRAKLFALQKATELGKSRNVVVMLFSDNNSELEMGTDERKKLEALEASTTAAETIPLLSQGVSPLWMTLYTNSFPDSRPLPGPDGETDLESPRLAWAARRMGTQVLEFIEPANPRISSFPATVSVQFLGPVQPDTASLMVDGQGAQKAEFREGRASWSLPTLKPGSHVLVAQAVLPDGKVRNAELPITVASGGGGEPGAGTAGSPPGSSSGTNPGPGADSSSSPALRTSPTPSASPSPGSTLPEEGGSGAPWVLLLLLAAAAVGVFLLSTKPARVRVVGPQGEESYVLAKGGVLRLGGTARVENELIFSDPSLSETIAEVRGGGFGKAVIAPNPALKDGTVEVETDDGHMATENGEPLLTTATVTWTSARGQKEVYSVIKEGAQKGGGAGSGEHFGGGALAGDDDGGDWRS
jgi:hypothetical protein